MMCDDVLRRLDSLLLGAVDGREEECLEAHIETCASCRDEYEQRAALLEHVREALRHPLPVNRLAELRHQIFLEETERRTEMLVREGLRGMLRRAVVVAAMFAVLAWLGAGLEKSWRSRTLSPVALEKTIERLVNSEDESPSLHGFVLGHRVSLERYLAATTGDPLTKRTAAPAKAASESASKTTHDRVGSEDLIETRWNLHYSV